jgi:hypothetical protein
MYYYYCPEHSLEYVEGEQKALNPRNCQFFEAYFCSSFWLPFCSGLCQGDFRVLSQIDLWGWGFGFTTVWFLCCYEEKDSSGSNDKWVSFSLSLSLFVSFGKRDFCLFVQIWG